MRLNPNLLKTIVFIGHRGKDGKPVLHGTGFQFARMWRHDGLEGYTRYIVTAKHNIAEAMDKGQHEVFVRYESRTEGQGLVLRYFPTSEWLSHEDGFVDVSVLLLDDTVDEVGGVVFVMDDFLSSSEIARYGVGVGNEVATIGLFLSHHGEERNEPVVRMGNISCMPRERIQSRKRFGAVNGYIIEARSFGGLSGSPVFVDVEHEPEMHEYSRFRDRNPQIRTIPAKRRNHILGLILGHWDMQQVAPPGIKLDPATRLDGAINMGMSIVIPSQHILDTINSAPVIARQNQLIEARVLAERDKPDA